MTKKFHIVFLLVMLGFFLIPAITYACETESGKSCCNKEASSKSKNRDCCKNDNHSKNKDNDSCGGKSKHSSCSCSIFHISTALIFEIELKSQYFHFFNEKENFYNSETNLSSGFSSIWLIPKIS